MALFTSQFVEQRTSPNKFFTNGTMVKDTDQTGLQYETMLFIIRAFAAYDAQYMDNGKWGPIDMGQNALGICKGNRKYAVLNTQGRANARRVPSEIVFTLSGDHWTIEFNKPYAPTEGDFSVRIEFFFNLFVICLNSVKEYTKDSVFIINSVIDELVRYGSMGRDGPPPAPTLTGSLVYIWNIYLWMLGMRRQWNVNISEVTQLLIGYSILRCSVEANFDRSVSYGIMDKFTFFYDKDFTSLREQPDDKIRFRGIMDEIASNFTNLFSHNPIHNALFCKDVNGDSLENFAIEMFKRTSAMKTLLQKEGVILKNEKFEGSVCPDAWYKSRDGLLSINKTVKVNGLTEIELDLRNGSYDKLDKKLNDYLVRFNNMDTSNYSTIALGIPVVKNPGNELGMLPHLKFILLVVFRILYNHGYRDDTGVIEEASKNSLVNMTDEEFLKFYSTLRGMSVPVQSLRGDPYIFFDKIIETLCIYGVFELASVIINLLDDEYKDSGFEVSFKRISDGEPNYKKYGRASIYSIVTDIVASDQTVEL